MANTEVKNLLKLIYDAVNVIDKRKAKVPAKDTATIQLLERAEDALWVLQGNLVAADIERNIGKLKADSRRLGKVNTDLQAAVKSLNDVANAVSNVANALGALVQVVTIAAGAGLL